MTRRLLALAFLAPAGIVLIAATPSEAAPCKVMTVRYAFSEGAVITVDPQDQQLAYGGCVQFHNAIATTVTVTVTGGYSRQLGPGDTTSTADAYVGTASGRKDVTARSGPTSASGTITVARRRPASQSPSPRRTTSASPAQTSATPTTTRSSSGTGLRVAPTPRRHRSASPLPAPTTTPVVPAPLPSPSPSLRVVAGPLEPASGRGAGLPAAVAALAVVGTASGLVRVLLAEPVVDSGPDVGGRP